MGVGADLGDALKRVLAPVGGPRSRLRAWIVDRFDQRTYLGLHLTAGLVVAAGAIWAFSALLDAVLDNATLVRMDIATDAWVHARVAPLGLVVANWISWIGSPTVMAVVGIIGAIVLWLRGKRILCVAWIAAFAGGGVLDRVLKAAVHRTRPTFGAMHGVPAADSFPSGHSMASFIGFAMLAYVLLLHRPATPRRRVATIAAATTMVALVGLSRVYLGRHYPSDVLAGWMAAAAWTAICLSGLVIALHRRVSVSSN